MTPTEKLQKLIEIAWGEGWRLPMLDDDEKPSYWYAESIMQGCIGPEGEGIVVSESENSILFEKEFVAALRENLKKKRGTKANRPPGMLTTNQILQYLAILDNRIDYLWENFGGEK